MNRTSYLRAGTVTLLGLLAACQMPPSESDEEGVDYEILTEELVNNGPTGTMTAQYTDSPAGEGVANLMDGKASTKFLTFHKACWVRWKGSSKLKAATYALTSANDSPGRDPKSWTLQGSADGTTWTQLDSRTGQTFTSRGQKKSYTIATPGTYLYYRLNVTGTLDPLLNTLQAAEWDLNCVATSITPYVQVNGGTWQQTTTATVAAGSSVKFGPQPTSGGSWKWTGPNGFSATSREITITNVQSAQLGNYVATYTNAGGCKSTKTFTIALSGGGGSGDWSTFVYPTVTFSDQAVGLEGSTIFKQAIPDPAGMMREQLFAVVKQLYADNLDRRVNFTKLNLILEDNPNGVAWKAGSPPEITIGISAQYIANFFHNNGNNLSLVNKEVRGVLSHEATHGYQWEPKNCGAYDGSSVFWAFIEGEADAVRAELTNWTPTRSPSKGGTWNGGYTRTGFFLSWCKQKKKPTFLIELNHAARDMATFTWDAAFQQILGQSVQQVWDEYQASLP